MKKFIIPIAACLLIAGTASAQTTPAKTKEKAKTTTAKTTATPSTTATTQTTKPATTGTQNATIRKKYHHKAKKPATKTKVE